MNGVSGANDEEGDGDFVPAMDPPDIISAQVLGSGRGDDVTYDVSGRSGAGRCECEGRCIDAALKELVNSSQDQLNAKDVVIQSKESLYQSTVDKADVWRDLANSLREQITLKDEKILEMDRHIKTLSVQLSDLQTRLLAAEALSSTLRVELDCAKDDVRSRVTSEASFASMEAALRAKSAQVSTMESLVKAREGQVDAMKRLLAAEAASNSPRPNTAMEDSIPVHQTRQEPSISPAPLMRGEPPEEFNSLDHDQAQAQQSEEEAALHQRDAGAAAGSSGVVVGRSFADTVRN